MADTGILATTAQIQHMAGANCSAVSNVEAYTNVYVALAEGIVNTLTRENWCDSYTGLNTDVKGVLALATASKAAQMVINYDLSGMGGREAETRLDFLENVFNNCIKILQDIIAKDFVNGA
jgi:hypothetical protein